VVSLSVTDTASFSIKTEGSRRRRVERNAPRRRKRKMEKKA
jgi:hypothetical protein